MKTMKEVAEERQKDKIESRRRIYQRLANGETTIDRLANTYLSQNYNNIMLYDTLSILAKALFDDYAVGEAYIPFRMNGLKDNMYKMERCRQEYEKFRRTMFKSESRVFERITDLYYEAVMRPMQLLEINIKQQLDKIAYTHSRYLSKLETLRQITMLGVGIKWAIEDVSYVVKNSTGKAGLVRGAHSSVDHRADMSGIQHWIIEMEKQVEAIPVKASDEVEQSFKRLEDEVISADLCLECTIIIGDEMGWTGLPDWFPILREPNEEERKEMKYKNRQDIEG